MIRKLLAVQEVPCSTLRRRRQAAASPESSNTEFHESPDSLPNATREPKQLPRGFREAVKKTPWTFPTILENVSFEIADDGFDCGHDIRLQSEIPCSFLEASGSPLWRGFWCPVFRQWRQIPMGSLQTLNRLPRCFLFSSYSALIGAGSDNLHEVKSNQLLINIHLFCDSEISTGT